MLQDINDNSFSGINGFVNNRPYIMLNAKPTSEHIRSTIAHELANLMFNWNKTNLNENEIEEYCTAIGGAFLFPKVDAIRELGINRKCISKDMTIVASEYGISMLLLAKRAQLVNIITSSAAKEFYILASKLGWRKKEPSRIKVNEKPLLFEQLVYRAINENEISMQRGAELLKVSYNKVVNDCCFNRR